MTFLKRILVLGIFLIQLSCLYALPVPGGTDAKETPTLSVNKDVLAINDKLVISYTNMPTDQGIWIGVYEKGSDPATAYTTSYVYIGSNASGSFTHTVGTKDGGFDLWRTPFAVGKEYFIGIFSGGKTDGQYTEFAPRINLSIAGEQKNNLKLNKKEYYLSDTLTINYSEIPTGESAWVGIYKKGLDPNKSASCGYVYVNDNVSGTINHTVGTKVGDINVWNTTLEGGQEYFVCVYSNNQYDGTYKEFTSRIAFKVLNPSFSLSSTSIKPKEALQIAYSNLPSGADTYLAIYENGAEVGSLDNAIAYKDVSSLHNGDLQIVANALEGTFDKINSQLQSGKKYDVVVFRKKGDVSTELLSRQSFTVADEAAYIKPGVYKMKSAFSDETFQQNGPWYLSDCQSGKRGVPGWEKQSSQLTQLWQLSLDTLTQNYTLMNIGTGLYLTSARATDVADKKAPVSFFAYGENIFEINCNGYLCVGQTESKNGGLLTNQRDEESTTSAWIPVPVSEAELQASITKTVDSLKTVYETGNAYNEYAADNKELQDALNGENSAETCQKILSLTNAGKELKIMQFNIWMEGTIVGGVPAIVSNIIANDPEVVTFSEIKNYNDVAFIDKLVTALQKEGKTYYGTKHQNADVGIISKYPILEQSTTYAVNGDRGSVVKSVLSVGSKRVAVYSAHLDWKNCAYYLPRGYNSSTWAKLAAPVVDMNAIMADNVASYRDEEINAFIKDAKSEQTKGSMVFISGDFNEPSHLDWQEDTKAIRDHQNLVINWTNSVALQQNGYKDSFREIYPNPVTNPGFTFPSQNDNVDVSKLTWAADADERDRIDFIYCQDDSNIVIRDSKVVGPSGSVLRGKVVGNTDEDVFIAPSGIWPTDHKAVLSTFYIYTNDNVEKNETSIPSGKYYILSAGDDSVQNVSFLDVRTTDNVTEAYPDKYFVQSPRLWILKNESKGEGLLKTKVGNTYLSLSDENGKLTSTGSPVSVFSYGKNSYVFTAILFNETSPFTGNFLQESGDKMKTTAVQEAGIEVFSFDFIPAAQSVTYNDTISEIMMFVENENAFSSTIKKAKDVIWSKKFTNDKWYAVSFPEDVLGMMINSTSVKIRLKEFVSDKKNFKEVDYDKEKESIAKGSYIIKFTGDSASYNVLFGMDKVKFEQKASFDDYVMNGTGIARKKTGLSGYVLNDTTGVFVYQADASVQPFEAFIPVIGTPEQSVIAINDMDKPTGINEMKDGVSITVVNHGVKVSNGMPFRIVNLPGIDVTSQNYALPAGIYMVIVNGKTYKISIP